MSEKRLYTLVNPSDAITFRATLVEAAIIADRMLDAPYFVKDAETGETPKVDDLPAEYDAIWFDAEKIASYSAAYASFLVGTRSERELFEEAVCRMTPDEATAYRDKYHDRRRTSMNDICKSCWDAARKIAIYPPEKHR
jgi:hypothetical protein